ncbi:hypothetical protein HaLaN_20740 [Haematococcus lacustris]|uniref:Uncharacterized protein n=1 Tax=Haematococcus lacustris TaxID=44745 RepID=A0A699ZY07_HAELA|nr:hypothetical protein HaLaN_20740 [Haematococcus lacustris]
MAPPRFPRLRQRRAAGAPQEQPSGSATSAQLSEAWVQRSLLLDRLSLALDVASAGLLWCQTQPALAASRHLWVASARVCGQLVLMALVQYQMQHRLLHHSLPTYPHPALPSQPWQELPPHLLPLPLDQLLPDFLVRLVQSRTIRIAIFLVKCARHPVQLRYSLLPCLVEAEVYLDPKWARQRLRLYEAQDRALEQFFKKLEEDMAEVSMERHGRAKQLVVFFGAAGIGTRGGWGWKPPAGQED